MRKSIWVAAILFAATFVLSAQVSYWFQGFQRQGDAAKARAYLGVGTNSISLTGSVSVAVGPKLTGATNGLGTLITVSAPDMATTNDVIAATNGYPWGVLYDPAGSATAATNGFTTIVFSNPASFYLASNPNGYAPTSSVVLISSNQNWMATNGFTSIVYSNASLFYPNSNPSNFIRASGDRMTGPLFSSSPSTNAPEHDELVTAEWVRSLLINGVLMYNSTNLAPGFVRGAVPFLYLTNIPRQFSRVYAGLTNNQYVGAVAVTNLTNFSGPVVVSAYLGTFGGSANAAITVKPEIYYSYDNGTNLLGNWDAQAQPLDTINGGGITNRYDWVVSVPAQVFTGTATVYRVFKVVSVSGTPNKPSLAICGGTNTPGQISFNIAGSGGSTTITTVTSDGLWTNDVNSIHYGLTLASPYTPSARIFRDGGFQFNTNGSATVNGFGVKMDPNGDFQVRGDFIDFYAPGYLMELNSTGVGVGPSIIMEPSGTVIANSFIGNGSGLTNLSVAVAPGNNVSVATNPGPVYVVSASTGGGSGVSNFGMRRVSFFEQDSFPGAFHASLGMTPNVTGNSFQFAATATDNPYNLSTVIAHNQCGVKDTYANFVTPGKAGLFRFVLAPTNTTNIRLFAGLIDLAAATYIFNVQDPTNQMAAFRLSTNNANWWFITGNGSSSTPTDTGVSATTSQVTLDIQYTGTAWIGTIGAVSVTNTLTIPTLPMSPMIELFNTDANATGCKIWGYYGEQVW